MTSPLRMIPAATIAAAAFALPAAAGAAQTVGSSFDTSRGTTTSLTCQGCSFAIDQIDGMLTWTDPGVVTSFTAKLGAGSLAKLRVYTREGSDRFVPVHTSGAVSGTGEVATYPVSIPVPSNATIGLAMHGSIAAIDGTGRVGVAGTFGDGSAEDSSFQDVEPLLSATVESDYDEDGLGDETQDSCVFCATGNGNGNGNGTGGGDTGGGGSGSGGGGGTSDSTATKGNPRANENIRSRHVLTVQDIGVVTRAHKPVATAYLYNPHNDAVTGTATLKVGGKVVAKTRAYASTIDELDFKVSRAVGKKLAKGTKGTVTANVSSDENGKESDSYPVAFKPAVTTRYDGNYRAKGPIVIKVSNGIVETATASLFLSSTNGSGSMTRAFYLPSGVPAVIGKDGKVEVHGHSGSDEVRFKAEFKKNGTIKGYISQWYYQFGTSSSGRFISTPFLGASNWIAKKG